MRLSTARCSIAGVPTIPYRPQNLAVWAREKGSDPARLAGAVRADDPKVSVP